VNPCDPDAAFDDEVVDLERPLDLLDPARER
jgi:hypothetical protein